MKTVTTDSRDLTLFVDRIAIGPLPYYFWVVYKGERHEFPSYTHRAETEADAVRLGTSTLSWFTPKSPMKRK